MVILMQEQPWVIIGHSEPGLCVLGETPHTGALGIEVSTSPLGHVNLSENDICVNGLIL